MKKVAIFTTFQGYLESYSLCAIARQQLKMLKNNGYDARFIFRGGDQTEWAKWSDDIKLIPDYIVDNDGNSDDMVKRSGKSMEQLIMDTLQAMDSALEGVDVVITHDLIYQSSNNIQDQAAVLYAEKHPEVLWLHWIHSATSPRDLNKTVRVKYKNSFLVYPNSWDVPRVARNFGYEETDVKVVPHAIDISEFCDFHPITDQLVDHLNLFSADVIGVYPLRLDRGKQPDFCIRIFNEIKNYFKRSIRLIIVDFQSTGGDKVTFRDEMIAMAANYGWASNELTFMSQFHRDCFLQTPKKVVRDLFMLANLYIHPSKSETYSLTTQEARLFRNMLILNFDFPAMRAIYGDGPMYRKFSACVNPLEGTDGHIQAYYHPNIEKWCRDVAGNALYHLENQAVLKMSTETRQNKNMQTVFKRHVEPLIYGMAIQK